MYDNEAAVGDALERSPIPREEVFVVTKVNTNNLAADAVHESTRRSRERLGLETIDLLLIHAPRSHTPLEETLGAMNELQAEGVVAHIGVSNFSVDQLERARGLSATPIVTNQVKYHPYHDQRDLLRYCLEHDVCLTAYSPLAEGAVVGDDRLEAIGDEYGKSAAQVALRWLIQQSPVAAIPKASSRSHIETNAEIFDFELSEAELTEVFELGDGLLESLARRLGF